MRESSVGDVHSSSETRPAYLTPAKVGYFGTYFAFAAIQPYYGIFLTRKGFNATMVGMITALMPIFNLVCLSPLAYMADRRRRSLQISTLAAITATFVLIISCLAKDQWLVAFSVCLHFIGIVPLAPLMDQHTMSMLPEDRRNEWGLLRSYGVYGWGIGAPIVSLLVTFFGWGVSGVQFALGMMAMLYCMHNGRSYDEPQPIEMHSLEVFLFLLQRKRLLVFWLAVCCMGMGYVIIGTYLFIFLTEIGAPSFLLGISVTVTVIFEIPFFRHAEWLHKHFTDVDLMTIAMMAWIVRVLGYSILRNPWYVLMLEPLHGFTFGAMWLASMHLVRHHYPAELGASSVGILTAGMFGIGPIIGNVVGGLLYGALGARGMLRVTGVFMALMLLLFRVASAMLEEHVGVPEVTVVEYVNVDPSCVDEAVEGLGDLERREKCQDPSLHVVPSAPLVAKEVMLTEDHVHTDVNVGEEIDAVSAPEIK